MIQISAPELAAWLADPARPSPMLLDVREPWEIQTCALPGIVAIPLREIPARVSALSQDQPIVCICHHGARSAQAAMFLASRGFDEVINLQGGIDAWSRQVDPSVPVY